MTVANPVTVAPMQMAVADQAAMAVMMPMAVAAMHLNQQVAVGSCFRNGRLRCDGRRGNRSEQGSHPNSGRCQGHLRQHDFPLLGLGRPASSIRAYLCMSTLNLAATGGSSGIHPTASRQVSR
jgi:hypothetical protein